MIYSNVLVTGGAGFIGSNLCMLLRERQPSVRVTALDSLKRRGSELNLTRLLDHDVRFVHGDIRCTEDLEIGKEGFDLIIECSAEPSVLAGFGDNPNELPLVELDTRWEYANPEDFAGISETCRIDRSKHSLFGASKLAADIMVQEYGRYFGLKSCCLRGGCLTGPNHASVELHGFLSFLLKCNLTSRKYTICGYKGKQVRDNIHSLDVARFIEGFIDDPRCAEVYNLGGGRENSCSILEAFDLAEAASGIPMVYAYDEKSREGDHICYISDLSRMKRHYPQWDITKSLEDIVREIHESWVAKPEIDLSA